MKVQFFYNLTADVAYSVCQFDYFYNTTVPPSVLDGGSTILLANMLNPRRLICSKDFHMARPMPSHSYVLVNRSIVCNCHLQSGLNYLLKLLDSCEPGAAPTMYFTLHFSISCQYLACPMPMTRMAGCSPMNMFLTYF